MSKIMSAIEVEKKVNKKSKSERPVVEIALFFDEAAYKLFSQYFKNDDKKLKDMLLAYVNGVQALYHHPSAGAKIDIMLTQLELFKKQPSDLPHYAGERSNLLDSFCAYNEKHNPGDDTNPKHWDMGLYVSGLDFYAVENGKRSGITMGLATVGGVCQPKYACVIAEFGVTNVLGKPYPSAGFTSVFVLAHEMGHNLGMHHDSYSNSCPKDGFIMSPSRGTTGETIWSYCSADILKKLRDWAKCLFDKQKTPPGLDHNKFGDAPGVVWGPKKQCQILLRDSDAIHDTTDLEGICQSLQCKTPHRAGFYFSGPALEGTSCGKSKRCQGGFCSPFKESQMNVQYGGWSKWKSNPCTSACIMSSKGFQTRRRVCDNPPPSDESLGCEGRSYDTVLCSDEKICARQRRLSTLQFATHKCQGFSKVIPELDISSPGLQAPHESGRLWTACAIFCRRSDSGSYYTPRLELNDLGISPYFPDGTWCHNDGKYNYYCLQHHCLPENFKLTKDFLWGSDIPIAQNALPTPFKLPKEVIKYLSVDTSGRPLSLKLPPGAAQTSTEDEWDIKDYVELPK